MKRLFSIKQLAMTFAAVIIAGAAASTASAQVVYRYSRPSTQYYNSYRVAPQTVYPSGSYRIGPNGARIYLSPNSTYNNSYSVPNQTYRSGYRGSYQQYPSYQYQPYQSYSNPGGYYGNQGYGYGYGNGYGNGYYYGTPSQRQGAAVGGAIGGAIGGQRGGNIGAAIGSAIGGQ